MKVILTLFLIVASIVFTGQLRAAEPSATAKTTQSAVLAGGCFWCMESDFDKLDGVISTTSGYAGGTITNPTYETYHDAGDGVIPHIEVVKVAYDTSKLNYADILNYYLRHVDPTDGGGQFCDRGPSYRPAIFVQNNAEKEQAQASLDKAASLLHQDIKVEILPDARFWPAEDYHQDYHLKNATKYGFYRWKCGRDQRVKDLWDGVK